MDRRTLLTRLAALVGGAAVAVASVPFIRYLLPSERAKALGSAISVDLSTFADGEVRGYIWRGMTVLVMKRASSHLDALELSRDRLLDDSDPRDAQPGYVDVDHRGRRPDFLVVHGNCTHLGCIPNQDVDQGKSLVGSWWPGGFVCACHFSMYDYAGRVVRGPAPTNLPVPPHWFETETTLIIGDDGSEAAS